MNASITLKDFLWLCSFPAIMSVGQILFREVAVLQSGKPLAAMLTGVAVSPLFYLAVTFYVFATALWIWLLTKYPLSVAYPVAVLAVVFTPVIDCFFFKQSISWSYWVGLGFVITGIQIIVRFR